MSASESHVTSLGTLGSAPLTAHMIQSMATSLAEMAQLPMPTLNLAISTVIFMALNDRLSRAGGYDELLADDFAMNHLLDYTDAIATEMLAAAEHWLDEQIGLSHLSPADLAQRLSQPPALDIPQEEATHG